MTVKRESEPTPAGDLSDAELQRELADLIEQASRGEVAGTVADRTARDARISDLRAVSAERLQPQSTPDDALDFPGADAPPEAPED